ncbi:MAG: magnesium transporter [Hyphomicrobiaceae bacterium]
MLETTESGATTVRQDVEDDVDGELVRNVSDALGALDDERVRRYVADLRAPDVADLIEHLAANERVSFVQALGRDIDYEIFSELDEAVRDQLSDELPNAFLARAVTELDSDDAAYVLENLQLEDRHDVLSQLNSTDRSALLRNLEYPDETAGRIMQSDFVAVAPFWNVGQVIDYMRDAEDLPDTFSGIYVVDPTYRVLGMVELSRLLRSKRVVNIEEIMDEGTQTVLATEDQEEVARQFERYDLISAPVVDDNERLVGVITVDDVVEVIKEEADEDIRLLGGVGDESVFDNVFQTTKSRFIWLLVNLGTAVLASFVIKLFDASIEQMVALAILMPIVASMGGNAGTQTMTVAVRAIATRELGPVNAARIVLRETSVGLINGALFAVILGGITVFWFGSGALGLVIAAAMVFNHLAAALAGILIPISLDRLGYDPAISSSVFVTTVTDIIGFFAFLGLATIWLL